LPVFTLCRDEQERSSFIMTCADGRSPADSAATAAVVVLCVRADCYDRYLRYGPLRTALGASAVPLGPMSADELREAITSPAEAARLQVEPGLPELLLSNVGLGDPPGIRPHGLRCRACTAGDLAAAAGRHPDRGGLPDDPGIRKAVATTAEREPGLLDTGTQRLATALFMRLVKVGDGTVDVCRPASRDALLRDLPDRRGAANIMDRFTRARLLAQEQDTVTIAYEALLVPGRG
jgi:hypothetical protein